MNGRTDFRSLQLEKLEAIELMAADSVARESALDWAVPRHAVVAQFTVSRSSIGRAAENSHQLHFQHQDGGLGAGEGEAPSDAMNSQFTIPHPRNISLNTRAVKQSEPTLFAEKNEPAKSIEAPTFVVVLTRVVSPTANSAPSTALTAGNTSSPTASPTNRETTIGATGKPVVVTNDQGLSGSPSATATSLGIPSVEGPVKVNASVSINVGSLQELAVADLASAKGNPALAQYRLLSEGIADDRLDGYDINRHSSLLATDEFAADFDDPFSIDSYRSLFDFASQKVDSYRTVDTSELATDSAIKHLYGFIDISRESLIDGPSINALDDVRVNISLDATVSSDRSIELIASRALQSPSTSVRDQVLAALSDELDPVPDDASSNDSLLTEALTPAAVVAATALLSRRRRRVKVDAEQQPAQHSSNRGRDLNRRKPR